MSIRNKNHFIYNVIETMQKNEFIHYNILNWTTRVSSDKKILNSTKCQKYFPYKWLFRAHFSGSCSTTSMDTMLTAPRFAVQFLYENEIHIIRKSVMLQLPPRQHLLTWRQRKYIKKINVENITYYNKILNIVYKNININKHTFDYIITRCPQSRMRIYP